MTRRFVLAAFIVATTGGFTTAAVEQPAASSCQIQPDKLAPVRPAAGREVFCGLDLGSKSVKLSVVSMEPGRNQTVTDERLCKRSLGMGALVFDSKAGVAKPLPDASIRDLIETVSEFKEICGRDGGHLVATGATQWARDATNIKDVAAQVAAATAVQLTVLTPAQEAEYAHVAASVGAPGRIVIDPGSNSFQLSWRERRGNSINSVLVPYGYVRGATNDIEPAATYAAGRAAYQSTAKNLLEEQLGRLSPPMSLQAIRRLVSAGSIGPEIITLGQDGAMHLFVRGLLRSAGGWVNSSAAYDEVLSRSAPLFDPAFGRMSVAPLQPAELSSYVAAVSAKDFDTLKSEPVRSLYGQRALVVPALADLLVRELGATRVVIVPQELSTGLILASLKTR